MSLECTQHNLAIDISIERGQHFPPSLDYKDDSYAIHIELP